MFEGQKTHLKTHQVISQVGDVFFPLCEGETRGEVGGVRTWSSGIPQLTINENKVTSREEFLRRTWKASTAMSSNRLVGERRSKGVGVRDRNHSPVHGASFSAKNSGKGRRKDEGCPLSMVL